jgi:hypothetical protein
MSRNVADYMKKKKTIFIQNKAAADHAMPVWQLVDDGIQGNDCPQGQTEMRASNPELTVQARGREGKRQWLIREKTKSQDFGNTK